jgi:hypothetical protein
MAIDIFQRKLCHCQDTEGLIPFNKRTPKISKMARHHRRGLISASVVVSMLFSSSSTSKGSNTLGTPFPQPQHDDGHQPGAVFSRHFITAAKPRDQPAQSPAHKTRDTVSTAADPYSTSCAVQFRPLCAVRSRIISNCLLFIPARCPTLVRATSDACLADSPSVF